MNELSIITCESNTQRKLKKFICVKLKIIWPIPDTKKKPCIISHSKIQKREQFSTISPFFQVCCRLQRWLSRLLACWDGFVRLDKSWGIQHRRSVGLMRRSSCRHMSKSKDPMSESQSSRQIFCCTHHIQARGSWCSHLARRQHLPFCYCSCLIKDKMWSRVQEPKTFISSIQIASNIFAFLFY